MRAVNPRWLAGLLLAIAAFSLGCAATRPHVSAPVTAAVDPNSLPGPAMFKLLCSQCHGPEAAGYAADNAPSLVSPTFLETATDNFLRLSIERGRPGTSMAAYSKFVGGPLDPNAIDRLVAWIRSHGPPARDLPPIALGDSTRGRPLYEARCQSCHGDLQKRGDAVMLANAGFLAVANDAYIQYAILKGRPGTAMASFAGTLDSLQVADLVAYVRSFARPFDASRLPPATGKEPLFAYRRGKAPEFTIREGRFVGVDQVALALQQRRKLVIIDARPESDWRTTHIAGAISVPHYQLSRLDEIPKDAWVITYCACPHHLSGVVVDSLRARGRPHAFVLDEGVLEWERRGYPIVAAPGVALPPAQMRSPGGATR